MHCGVRRRHFPGILSGLDRIHGKPRRLHKTQMGLLTVLVVDGSNKEPIAQNVFGVIDNSSCWQIKQVAHYMKHLWGY